MTELEKAREIISAVDTEMAALFEKRMQAAEMVAAYKKEKGLQIFDPVREAALLERSATLIQNDAYRSYYVTFLQQTMDISKAYQRRLMEGMRVAYSGVKGAFAQLAAEKIFPEAAVVSYADFAAAYRAVEQGECDVAVLPIENSYNGDVGQVMDLAHFGSLHINGIYGLEVTQNLLALPESRMEELLKENEPKAAAQKLMDAALKAGGRDNISVVVVRDGEAAR